ncbi:T9SS type A sorting domain-containing protein [candidate division KSB1 bacterium]|nr:T9SS type A sorting domain-containing protein [candidate division KSB1 bacterium]
MASVNGTDFYGYGLSGSTGDSWIPFSLALTDVPTLGDISGSSSVWITFGFTSDGTTQYEGVYLDDIVLEQGNAEELSVISSFASPGSSPWGLTYDGTNLWNADDNRDRAYKLSTSGTTISSFATPSSSPAGMAWDGANLWLADDNTGKIYKLTTSGSIVSSFQAPGDLPTGLAWDGNNLWLCDLLETTIWKLTTTGQVVTSFSASGSSHSGLCWNGRSLLLSDSGTLLLYELDTAGNIQRYYLPPELFPTDLAWDGSNYWLADAGTDRIYKLEGSVVMEPPRNLQASVSSDKVVLQWQPPSAAPAGYCLYRSSSSPVALIDANRIATLSQSVTSYEDANVASGQTYYYVATARYDAGESGPSNEAQATLPEEGPGPTVRIDPSSTEIQLDETGTVSVVIDSVNDLGSFEFTISYNPRCLLVAKQLDVSLGSFLASTGRTVTPVGPTIDQNNGKVTFGAFSFGSNPAPSIDRGGVLAIIKWTAHDTGTAVLAFESIKLTHANGNEIPNIKTIDGQVTVPSCYWADVDCDGDVDIVDIQLVAGKWNSSCGDANYDPACDVDNDCDIDIVDIQKVAGQWGWPNSQGAGYLGKVAVTEEKQEIRNLVVRIERGKENTDGTQTVEILADNVSHLGAFQFDLVYDNRSLRVKEVQAGDIFTNSPNSAVTLGPEIDQATGRLRFGSFSYGTETGPCGSGVLARVTFESQSSQQQSLRLENVLLTNQRGELLAVSDIANNSIGSDVARAVPADFTLGQNYPNPFNPRTVITFGVPSKDDRDVRVILAIHNLNGQLIRTLMDEAKQPGYYTVEWDGANESGQQVSSGVYFYAINAEDYRAVKKMVFTR